MTLKTIVKVGGITNLSDARYCAGMGVDMLGFCFSQNNSNYIEMEKFQEIAGWVSGVEIIAEFENENINEIEEILSTHAFDGILTSNLDSAQYFQHKNIKVISSVDLNGPEDLAKFEQNLAQFSAFDFIQISSENEAVIEAINQKLLGWTSILNILNSFSHSEEKLLDQISKKSIKGIALTGTHELKPGMKDYDEIADILELLEEED